MHTSDALANTKERMNYVALHKFLTDVAEKNGVRTVMDGPVQENMLRSDILYPACNIEYQGISVQNSGHVQYRIRMVWAERELADESNRKDNWSNAVRFFSKLAQDIQAAWSVRDDVIDVDTAFNVDLFYQKFADLTSGGYADLRITAQDDQCD